MRSRPGTATSSSRAASSRCRGRRWRWRSPTRPSRAATRRSGTRRWGGASRTRGWGEADAAGLFADVLVGVVELHLDVFFNDTATTEKLATLKPAFRAAGTV